MRSRPLSRVFLALVFTVLACLAAGDGLAGPRDERLQDTPVASSAFTREDLANTRLALDVVGQLNAVRANPQAFADILRGPQPRLRGIGAGDRAEAAAFLDSLDSRPPLAYSPALSDIALFHARDIGSNGLLSHTGSQGTTMGGRFRARGLTPTMTAEELSFSQRTGTDVVLSLIIDAGVPGKPHRNDLFNPVFTFVGVGCAPHKTMGQVCVINLSNGFMRPPPPISLAPTPANASQFNCPPGLLPGNPDAVRLSIADAYAGQFDSFPEPLLDDMTSAGNLGQQHLGAVLGASPGAYNSMGSAPWTPPQDTTQLPRWCGAWAGETVAGTEPAPVAANPIGEPELSFKELMFDSAPFAVSATAAAPYWARHPDVTPYMTPTPFYTTPNVPICTGSSYVDSLIPIGQLGPDEPVFRVSELWFNPLADDDFPLFPDGDRSQFGNSWTTPYCTSAPEPGVQSIWDFPVNDPSQPSGVPATATFDPAPADYTPGEETKPEDETPM